MDHKDIVQALTAGYPDAQWSYDGDGTSLDPVTDEDGTVVSRGLEWHGDTATPTLDELEQALPAAQQAAALTEIRSQRDELLAGCDWTQLPDAPLDAATKQVWTDYRQQLRGFPDQKGFDPLDPPAWPSPPAGSA